jgi:hypothetical protein
MAQVLRQAGACLTQLSGKILDLEHALWRAHPPLDERTVAADALQSIDFMKQASDDLAALLDRLGDAAPLSLTVSEIDVIAPMKLEALRTIVGDTASCLNTVSRPTKQEGVDLF